MRSWVLITVAVLLVGGLLTSCSSPEVWTPTEEELTDEGYPMAFLIGPKIEEALQHSEVRALFKDLPPEDERQPDARIVCSDYHELLRVLKNLGYSEEFIEEVMHEADF